MFLSFSIIYGPLFLFVHFVSFLQGIHPSIKGAVWEFLLGCYDPDSTFEERNKLRNRRRYY